MRLYSGKAHKASLNAYDEIPKVESVGQLKLLREQVRAMEQIVRLETRIQELKQRAA